MKIRTRDRLEEIPAHKTYRFLESGPIVLVSTAHQGVANVMTMGFHMVVQHNPPLVGCVIGPWDHSYQALTATGECVIAIPGMDLAEKVVDIGNCSGESVDKFKKFRLTAVSAAEVAAPLIGECLTNIECKVIDTRLVESYQLFILQALRIWSNPARKERRTLHHQGDGTFTVDGRTIDLKDRMLLWKDLQD